jgi:hypothetical protein
LSSSERGLMAEGGGSVASVKVKPAGERGVAVGAAGVDRAVGPAAEHGADESFRFAVGLGSVGAGADASDPERAPGDRVLHSGGI